MCCIRIWKGSRFGACSQADACALLGRSRRQVFRLLRGIREAGAASLLSKRRGKLSNRRLPDAVRQLAMTLVREHYSDFGNGSGRSLTRWPSRGKFWRLMRWHRSDWCSEVFCRRLLMEMLRVRFCQHMLQPLAHQRTTCCCHDLVMD